MCNKKRVYANTQLELYYLGNNTFWTLDVIERFIRGGLV